MNNIKTPKRGFVNDKALIAAVDISKDHLMVYARCPGGQELKPFKVSNDHEGLKTFWGMLRLYQIRYRLPEIIVGFESTGHYSEPLINFMKEQPVKLVQVNPMHTKKIKEVSDNSPNKTDKKDPRIIADLIQLGHYLSLIVPHGAAAELRTLSHTREAQLQYQNRLLNRLESLMFKVFPEFVQIIKDLSSKTPQYLMKRYPTPEQIKSVPQEDLRKEIRRVSRGRHKTELVQCLKQAAEISLGTKEGRAGLLLEINHILEQLAEVARFTKVLEGEMARQLEQVPYSKHLLSLKGLKVVTLAGVIGEVADFRNYRVQSEVVKLAGLDLYEISSGKQRGLRHISKRGRWLLRKLLFYASLNVVRRGGILYAYYQRLLSRGMKKIKALIAVARKLLRIMFALVRDGTNYIEDHKPNSALIKISA